MEEEYFWRAAFCFYFMTKARYKLKVKRFYFMADRRVGPKALNNVDL